MVALLVGLSIMAVMMSAALPTWRTAAQREREAELVFRGQQYARAITLFQRKFANAFPPNVDLLIDQKFLRKKYKDPISNSDFQLLFVGQTQGQGTNDPSGQQGRGGAAGTGTAPRAGGAGTPATQPAGLAAAPLGGRAGIMGVYSKSDAKSLREYNGRTKYNEWAFVALQANTRAGAPTGGQTPNGGVNGGVGGPGARGGGLQPGGGGPGTGRGGTPQPGGGRGRGGGVQPFGGDATQPFGGGARGGRF